MLALSSSLRLGNMWRERNMWHQNERVGRRSGRVRKRIEGDYGGGGEEKLPERMTRGLFSGQNPALLWCFSKLIDIHCASLSINRMSSK